jgi:hypothetical protein
MTLWVIFDRFSRCCLPNHVRFGSKATDCNQLRSNRPMTVVERTQTLSQWAEEYKISQPALVDGKDSESKTNKQSSIPENNLFGHLAFKPKKC